MKEEPGFRTVMRSESNFLKKKFNEQFKPRAKTHLLWARN